MPMQDPTPPPGAVHKACNSEGSEFYIKGIYQYFVMRFATIVAPFNCLRNFLISVKTVKVKYTVAERMSM